MQFIIMKGKGKRNNEGGIGSSSSPCAACKLLRRRCCRDCIFAPHFPANEPNKFASVHKVFGASNVSKMLQELPEQRRSDAVSAMVYEANARVRDPVYGCVAAISSLQQKVQLLQYQLALAESQVVQLTLLMRNSQLQHIPPPPPPNSSFLVHHHHDQIPIPNTSDHDDHLIISTTSSINNSDDHNHDHQILIETSNNSRSSTFTPIDCVDIILDDHHSFIWSP